jgi:GNAT superfamily N-acetyltransferase
VAAPVELESIEWLDPRAVELRVAMDAEMGQLYAPLFSPLPPEQQRAISNSLVVDPATIVETILALDGELPVGHAALRPYEGVLEVKRVYVSRSHRGRGISRLLMVTLEEHARALGIDGLIVQTGTLQGAAIGLYEKLGYERIPAYGAYAVMPFEVCFAKSLT